MSKDSPTQDILCSELLDSKLSNSVIDINFLLQNENIFTNQKSGDDNDVKTEDVVECDDNAFTTIKKMTTIANQTTTKKNTIDTNGRKKKRSDHH